MNGARIAVGDIELGTILDMNSKIVVNSRREMRALLSYPSGSENVDRDTP